MGTWGMGVLESDIAADVYGEYMEMYDEDHDTGEIRAVLQDRWDSCLPDEPVFWLALAQAQWECGCLDSDVQAQVEHIVASGADPDPEAWLNEEDREQRRAVLREFVQQIRVPCKPPRPRTLRRVYGPVYPAGTCLSVATLKGGFGAAIVLKVVQGKYDTVHLVGGLRGVHAAPPPMALFEDRDWLYLTHGNFKGKLHLVWCSARDHEEDDTRPAITVVGTTALRPTDPTADPDAVGTGVGFAGWGWVENQMWLQDYWDRGLRKPFPKD